MRVEERVGQLLREKGLTLSLAESCTGGLIAHLITNVPGSSTYFLGGVVAYANEAKRAMLGVKEETLQEHGAVSAETAQEMACGARKFFGSDLALGVTGIAGPGGATATKPVGLVYVALAGQDFVSSRSYHWQGSRTENKELTARAALRMLETYLEGREL